MIFGKNNDTSLLSGSLANAKTLFHGKEIDILKGTIGSRGVYTFNQTFPSVVLYSSLASASTSSHTITLKGGIDDVKVNDKVKIHGLRSRLKVHSFPGTKQIRLDQTVTLAADTAVKIERERRFGVEIFHDFCTTLGAKIPGS